MAERILVVDDEKLIRWALLERLAQEGYEVVEVADGTSACERIQNETFDLVLLDMRLPDMDGMHVLRRARTAQPLAPVLMITAFSTVGSAVEAMKAGALDYIAKPFDMDELTMTVARALETTALRRRFAAQVQQHKARFGLDNIVGVSPRIAEIKDVVRKIARSQAGTVLLLGESGVGKDLVARAIHYESNRADLPFMSITCTAVPDTLLESELFGHERGAVADARDQQKGILEIAQGGTVYLDEVGDLSLAMQAKVVRALEDKSFRRIGGTRDIAMDVRVIAAASRDLVQVIRDNSFNRDLYYHLSILPLLIPPLREHREDVPILAQHFLALYNREFRRSFKSIEPDALVKLMRHNWPGNVRELRNVLERAVLLSPHETITADDIFPAPAILGGHSTARSTAATLATLPEDGCNLEEVERELVRQALERTNGNQTHAARLLGVTRDQIRYRIEKFGFRTDQE